MFRGGCRQLFMPLPLTDWITTICFIYSGKLRPWRNFSSFLIGASLGECIYSPWGQETTQTSILSQGQFRMSAFLNRPH